METFSIYKKIKKHLSDDELIDTISQRNAGGAVYIWLGGSDKKKEGDWRWLRSNDKIEKHPYQSGNCGTAQACKGQRVPDNYKGEQHHLALTIEDWPRGAGQGELLGDACQWNDISEMSNLYFINEYINPDCNLA